MANGPALPTPNALARILNSHPKAFTYFIQGAAGYGQAFNGTQYTDAADYANKLGNVDTTNGYALRVQYGPAATPTTIATFAKAAVTFAVPVVIPSSSTLAVLTTAGDLPYGTGSGVIARLGIGTARQALITNAGATAPSWAASLQSLLLAAGSIIQASAANTPAELAIGTAYQALQANAGATALSYQASATSTLTAQADLLGASAANTLARIAKGTAFQELVMNSGATGQQWSSGPIGLAAAAGDIFQATGANALARLAIGTAYQVPAVNAGATALAYVSSLQSLMLAQGDTVHAIAANTPGRLAIGTTGQELVVVAGVPSWASGVLAKASTAGQVPYATGANAISMLSAGNNGDGLLLSGGLPVWSPEAAYSSPIPNANYGIWQNDTTFTSIADATWGPDGWIYGKVGAVVHDLLRSTDVPSVAFNSPLSSYSLQLDVTTVDSSIAAGDVCTIATRIEGYNWRGFAQRAFVLGFWVKAAKTGIHCVYFRNSGTSDRTYVAEYTVSVADTWEYKAVAVSASPPDGTWDYTTGRGLEIGWALSCGATFQTTAGSWQTGNFRGTSNQVNETDNTANNFRLYGAHLTLGAYDKPFMPLDNTVGQILAQRYFEVIQSDGALFPFAEGYMTTTTIANITGHYAPKRAVPTVTYDSTPGNYQLLVAGGAIDCTAVVTAGGPHTDRILIQATIGSAQTLGIGAGLVAKNATPFIKLDSRIP